MPPKKSATTANAKPPPGKGNNNRSGGGSFFVSLVPLFVVSPLILAGFFEISLRFGSSFVPSEDRPPLVILPFLGFSIFPLVAWLSYKASKALRRRFFLWRVLVWLPVLYLAGHNFFTILYGNINNEAYSNSWMIDVIAPPEYFEDFEAIQSEFQLATNTSRWPLALKAPSWDVEKVAANHACGPRVFVRFMAHNISVKARLSKLLDPKGLMFVGAWVLVEGKEGFRALRPKVFTDFAQGNDVAFNKWLIPRFGVDLNNLFQPFNNRFPDDETYHIDTHHPRRGDPYVVDAVDTGEDYPAGSKFLMDQYSCMAEAQLLHKVADRRWCFYKMMTAAKTRKLRGTISAPYLKEKLSFPSGSPEDCSKPYVNGILTEDLHWLRDTYSC